MSTAAQCSHTNTVVLSLLIFVLLYFVFPVMSYEYIDSLSVEARRRYETKLMAVGLLKCPFRLPFDSWKDEPTRWPNVQFPDLVMYLINTAGVYTHQAMKNFRSTEAHRYFTAGFVGAIRHYMTASDSVVFRAEVRPSQRSNNPSHQPWVATNKDGVVLAGHCTCMAGLGESCSHIAAVLFKIEAGVRLGLTTLASTSKPCKWNNFFTTKVEPARIRDIKLYGEKAVARVAANGRKRRNTFDLVSSTDVEQKAFLQSLLEEEPTPVALSFFVETAEAFRCKRVVKQTVALPQPLRALFREDNLTLSEEELNTRCTEVADKLTITPEQTDFVESQTRAQSKSIVWCEQRPGHITASFAHSVLHTNQETPAPSVVTGVTTMPSAPVMANSLKYGRDNEDVVFKIYEENVQNDHVNGKLRKAGMRISTERPWLSASTDGIITCDCHGTYVVEIKCPYAARDKTCEEFMKDPSSYIYGGHLKQDHPYYTQVQIQMAVYKVDCCDFLVKLKDGLIIVSIPKDEQFLEDILPNLETFWRKHTLRELLTRAIENYKKATGPPPTDDDSVYCYCQQPWDGLDTMVGCDGLDCQCGGWVHLSCIKPKRKTVPKYTWYCSICKKRKLTSTLAKRVEL